MASDGLISRLLSATDEPNDEPEDGGDRGCNRHGGESGIDDAAKAHDGGAEQRRDRKERHRMGGVAPHETADCNAFGLGQEVLSFGGRRLEAAARLLLTRRRFADLQQSGGEVAYDRIAFPTSSPSPRAPRIKR